MDLIQILKGARKRIEAAEHLSDGHYIDKNIMYGQCYCAVGHMLKEMGAEDNQLHDLEISYIGEFDFDELHVLEKEIKFLTDYEELIFSLQKVNDDSHDHNRKEKVLAKLDEIITKLESEQNGNPSN